MEEKPPATVLPTLVESVSAISEAENREALASRVLDTISILGFDSFNLCINARDRLQLVEGVTLSSFGDDFHDDYKGLKLYEIDPVVDGIFAHSDIFTWQSEAAPGTGRMHTLYEYLQSIPLTWGVVIPLPSKAGCVSSINVSSGKHVNVNDETVSALSIVARVAMLRAEVLGLCVDDWRARLIDAGLSTHQVMILNWAAEGKSNGDIATIIDQPRRTVDYHMSEILRKLKVASRGQAIALISGKGR